MAGMRKTVRRRALTAGRVADRCRDVDADDHNFRGSGQVTRRVSELRVTAVKGGELLPTIRSRALGKTSTVCMGRGVD